MDRVTDFLWVMVSTLGFVGGAPAVRFSLPFCGCVGRGVGCELLSLLDMSLVSCNVDGAV